MADQHPLDQLFRVLPDVPELAALREAMLGASVPDPARLWASASRYATFDKRVLSDHAVDDVIEAARDAALERVQQIFDAAQAVLGAARAGDSAAAASRLIGMGEAAESKGDAQQAAAWYAAAASLAAPLPARGILTLALRRLARARLSAGALTESESLYRAAADHSTAADDTAGRAVALTGLGNALSFQGRFADAGVCYEQALELTAQSELRLCAQLQVNLAMVAREQGRLDDARTWLTAARTAWDDFTAHDRSGWHNFAGLLALSLGALDDAHAEFVAALASAGGRFERAMVLDNMTEVALQRGQLKEAEVLARRAEQHALAAASPRALAEVYTRLGRIFRLRDDPNGVTFFDKALELCRRHDYPLLEAAACLEYASFRHALGDVDEARAYEQRAHELYARSGAAATP
jgi:tetratricopeptide (TPR) repeat protein